MLAQPFISLSKPILPPELLKNKLETCLNLSSVDSRFIVRLLNSQISPIFHNRVDQAASLFLVLKDVQGLKVSIRQVAKICECDHSKLSKILKKSRKPHGRQTILSSEKEEELILLINLYQIQNRPVTISFLRQYINDQFAIQVSRSWHQKFLMRHKDKIRIDYAIPQDAARLNLSLEYAEKHIQNLTDYVEGIPTELIFNIDEVGFQRWSDKKRKRLLLHNQLQKVKFTIQLREVRKE